MGYMNVDRLLTAMPDTVLKALKDGDPFVRKTAAMGVLKLFVHDKSLYDSNNLLDSLLMLLSDSSPSVFYLDNLGVGKCGCCASGDF